MSAQPVEPAEEQQLAFTRRLIGFNADARFGSMVQAAVRGLASLDGLVNYCAIFLHGMIC